MQIMTMGNEGIALTFALFTKHFVVDFPLQPRWMYANKGTFGHPGGIAHAWLHGMSTGAILIAFGINGLTAASLSVAEFVAHYLIDWAKMNINARMGWTPINAEAFWWLLGLDQWLHALCYIAIVEAISWA